MDIQRICVFCGGGQGRDPAYAAAAAGLGAYLAHQNIEMVYGGSRFGLMGVAADAALDAGGQVWGIRPANLEQLEPGHPRLTHAEVYDSIHGRKARMAELSDAFIILPGGVGTLDEFFEQWTWLQIAIHKKPLALMNVAGFYDPLLVFFDKMVSEGFMHPLYRQSLVVATSPEQAVAGLRAAVPLPPRWELK